MSRILIGFIAIVSLGITASWAKSAEERFADEMSKYERTNTFENCIRHASIKRTKVLDDDHILFEMRGKRTYLNKLSHTCHTLGFSRKFALNLHTSQLCNVDTITVLDSFLSSRGACGLGKFELLEKKTDSNS